MPAPDRGDLVFVDFNPQAGHEQAGQRPGIVLSPKAFNEATGFATVCPITTQKKGYPFEVELPEGLNISGVILTDQQKNLDWQARNFRVRDRVPDHITDDCVAKIHTFLNYSEYY